MSRRAEPATTLAAMFGSADALVEAVRDARRRGCRDLRAYSPFPLDELTELLELPPSPVRWWVLAGGLAGGVAGYAMQWYSAVVDYAILAGNRPLNAWPAFIPVTFELLVLGGAAAGFFAVLRYSGLPRLHHPVFDVEEFELESRSRFFLLVSLGAADDAEAARAMLRERGALRVREVAR